MVDYLGQIVDGLGAALFVLLGQVGAGSFLVQGIFVSTFFFGLVLIGLPAFVSCFSLFRRARAVRRADAGLPSSLRLLCGVAICGFSLLLLCASGAPSGYFDLFLLKTILGLICVAAFWAGLLDLTRGWWSQSRSPALRKLVGGLVLLILLPALFAGRLVVLIV